MAKQTLKATEKYVIIGFIKDHCVKPDGAMYAHWKDGLSDTVVADRFRPQFPNTNVGHIIHLRQEMNLILEPSRFKAAASTLAAYEDRMTNAEKLIIDLQKQMSSLHKWVDDVHKRLMQVEETYTRPKGDMPFPTVKNRRWLNEASEEAIARATLTKHGMNK